MTKDADLIRGWTLTDEALRELKSNIGVGKKRIPKRDIIDKSGRIEYVVNTTFNRFRPLDIRCIQDVLAALGLNRPGRKSLRPYMEAMSS